MEALYTNSSVLFISHRPLNYSSAEITTFEYCKNMPAALIWYLGLQLTNMFLGIPANIMVLWLIHKNKGDCSSSDIFIFQLAILDVLFCFGLPLELAGTVFLTPSSIWVAMRIFFALKDSSPLFLSCICLDRYVAVVHPIIFTKLKDRQYRTALALVVWLVILAYTAAKFVGNIVNFDKVFTAMILTAFAFMMFCNIAILWVLRQSGPGRDEMHPVKKRAFKMVLIILAIILFNYLPSVALHPFKHYFSFDVFRCCVQYVAFGFLNISSSIQPMLYLSKEKLLCSLSCCQTKPA
ncbi:uncharacterized protein V6R79_017008 [Siganus canaliculatus]